MALAWLGGSQGHAETVPPRSYSEGIDRLVEGWPPEDRRTFAETPYYDLARYHFGLGSGVRNEFRLWSADSALNQWFTERGVSHPDVMSSFLLQGTWLVLNACDLNVEDPFITYSGASGTATFSHTTLPPPEHLCPENAPIGAPNRLEPDWMPYLDLPIPDFDGPGSDQDRRRPLPGPR